MHRPAHRALPGFGQSSLAGHVAGVCRARCQPALCLPGSDGRLVEIQAPDLVRGPAAERPRTPASRHVALTGAARGAQAGVQGQHAQAGQECSAARSDSRSQAGREPCGARRPAAPGAAPLAHCSMRRRHLAPAVQPLRGCGSQGGPGRPARQGAQAGYPAQPEGGAGQARRQCSAPGQRQQGTAARCTNCSSVQAGAGAKGAGGRPTALAAALLDRGRDTHLARSLRL